MVCGAVHLASSRPPPPPPPPSLFFFLPLFHQCDGCLEWGLMAGLRGFASHGDSFLSRGWLATMEALGIPGTHLPRKRGSWLMIELGKHSYSTRLKNKLPYTKCRYYRLGHIFCSQHYITTDVMTDIERHRLAFRHH